MQALWFLDQHIYETVGEIAHQRCKRSHGRRVETPRGWRCLQLWFEITLRSSTHNAWIIAQKANVAAKDGIDFTLRCHPADPFTGSVIEIRKHKECIHFAARTEYGNNSRLTLRHRTLPDGISQPCEGDPSANASGQALRKVICFYSTSLYVQ